MADAACVTCQAGFEVAIYISYVYWFPGTRPNLPVAALGKGWHACRSIATCVFAQVVNRNLLLVQEMVAASDGKISKVAGFSFLHTGLYLDCWIPIVQTCSDGAGTKHRWVQKKTGKWFVPSKFAPFAYRDIHSIYMYRFLVSETMYSLPSTRVFGGVNLL